jgi:hypothetical protein
VPPPPFPLVGILAGPLHRATDGHASGRYSPSNLGNVVGQAVWQPSLGYYEPPLVRIR